MTHVFEDGAAETEAALVGLLRAEIAQLTADKTDLEMVLDNTTAHSTYIEAELDRTVRELEEERRKLTEEQVVSERLLLNVLPKVIADRLRGDHPVVAEAFPEASVLFADIAGFTPLAGRYPAVELVSWLNGIFSAFDTLTDTYGLEKIKTIGDSYMAVGGVPAPKADHAEAVAEMAIEMHVIAGSYPSLTGEPWGMRIGISTGMVVAGVIGTRKFIYDLWGDAVNMASRMESHGLVGAIQVTESTYERLRDQYRLVKRGTVYVKGKGEMTTYLLVGRSTPSLASNP
jgi:class 3 adenylate cyclase